MIDPLSDAAFSDLSSQGIADEDKSLRVEFFFDDVPDPKRSEEMGRPMFKRVEMCSIRARGDMGNVVIEPVHRMQPDPRRRFPALYQRWKAGEAEAQVEGTLLRKWGFMQPEEAKGYEAIDIFTVEQLAAMSDATCQQHRGTLPDRQKARDWLDKAKGLEPVAQARAENAKLRSEIEALKEAIEAMGGKVPEPSEPKRKKTNGVT